MVLSLCGRAQLESCRRHEAGSSPSALFSLTSCGGHFIQAAVHSNHVNNSQCYYSTVAAPKLVKSHQVIVSWERTWVRLRAHPRNEGHHWGITGASLGHHGGITGASLGPLWGITGASRGHHWGITGAVRGGVCLTGPLALPVTAGGRDRPKPPPEPSTHPGCC